MDRKDFGPDYGKPVEERYDDDPRLTDRLKKDDADVPAFAGEPRAEHTDHAGEYFDIKYLAHTNAVREDALRHCAEDYQIPAHHWEGDIAYYDEDAAEVMREACISGFKMA